MDACMLPAALGQLTTMQGKNLMYVYWKNETISLA